MVTVKALGGKAHTTTAEPGSTVNDVLLGMGLSPQVYIGAVNGEVVPVDHELQDGDDVLLIRMTSGG